jgi:hypothetical protein
MSTLQIILIGDLLVRSEMSKSGEVAEAIPVSMKTGLPIGRVLVASNALSEQHLHQALMAQSLIRDSLLSIDLAIQALRIVVRESFNLEQALKIVGWQPEAFTRENRLGQLLLAAGVISQSQLDEVLRIFYTTGLPLARVLVRKGAISNLVAYSALTSQQMLREEKLTRDQAVEAVRAASTSNARIEEDYVTGYLRLSPTNNLRLGELLILAQLISEDALIRSVDSALLKGSTLGEMLIANGLVQQDTMERALEAQRLVTKNLLDVSRAGDTLRRANYERITVQEAMEKEAPAVLLSLDIEAQADPMSMMRFGENPRFTATLKDIRVLNTSAVRRQQQRSHEETRVRELVSKLLHKLDGLSVRNSYMLNMIDTDAKNELKATDVLQLRQQMEELSDFDQSIDAIERLLTKIETCSYQNGFLRASLDEATERRNKDAKIQRADASITVAVKAGQEIKPRPAQAPQKKSKKRRR